MPFDIWNCHLFVIFQLTEWQGFGQHDSRGHWGLSENMNGKLPNIGAKKKKINAFCVVMEGAWESVNSATLRLFMCTVHVHDCIDIVLQRSFQYKRRRAECFPTVGAPLDNHRGSIHLMPDRPCCITWYLDVYRYICCLYIWWNSV